MDFYELNKKMNDSQCNEAWELPADGPIPPAPPDRRHDNEAEMTLKAHGGDRAKNLYGIADEIDSLTGPKSDPTAVFRTPELHKLKGYAEQLRIIADELRSGHLKGIADEIDSLTSGGRAVWRLPELHKLKGYVEQLKSIADELRSK